MATELDTFDAWYLVYTKPREENKAKHNLQNQDFNVFLPEATIEQLRAGKRVARLMPLFPRYLFVQLHSESNFAAIRSTRGCAGLVRFGDRYPTPINPALIKAIMSGAERSVAAENLPAPGDPVVIKEGPFRNLKAIFQEPDGDKRSLLLVELLGKQSKIPVANTNFAKS